MKLRGVLWAVLLFVAAISMNCSSDVQQCIPGASVACAGVNGCPGFQVCGPDGSSFAPCDCSGATSSTAESTSSVSAGGAGGAGSTSSTTSSTGAGGAGGGPWSPLDLPGLALWLDPDVGVVEDPQHVGTVLGWQDQSGNGAIATATGLQDGWRFDIDPVAFNGHIAIHCRGNGTYFSVPDSPALQWGTGDFLIAMVIKIDYGQSTASLFWGKNASQGNMVRFEYNNGPAFAFYVENSNVVVGLQDPTKFHIAIIRGPAPLRMQVDAATSTGATISNNIDNPGAPILLCQAGSNAYANTEIAEVVAVGGPVSNADVANLGSYFQQKFGL